MRLIPDPPGRIARGASSSTGSDLVTLPEDAMRRIRGNGIAMIFQEPMTALNPVIRIGEQIAEVLRLHRGLTRKQALDEATELLRKVGIADPAKRVDAISA